MPSGYVRKLLLKAHHTHISLEGRISDTVTVGKLSVMRTCERLPCGTRTECPYVVWLGLSLARLIIDSNRWLLISYKQLLHLAHVFASNIYVTMIRHGVVKIILLI